MPEIMVGYIWDNQDFFHSTDLGGKDRFDNWHTVEITDEEYAKLTELKQQSSEYYALCRSLFEKAGGEKD